MRAHESRESHARARLSFLFTMSGMYGVKDGVPAGVPSYASLSLAGKTVVVVGGTSGVGQAVALACAKKGAKVTVVGRTFKVREKREAARDGGCDAQWARSSTTPSHFQTPAPPSLRLCAVYSAACGREGQSGSSLG